MLESTARLLNVKLTAGLHAYPVPVSVPTLSGLDSPVKRGAPRECPAGPSGTEFGSLIWTVGGSEVHGWQLPKLMGQPPLRRLTCGYPPTADVSQTNVRPLDLLSHRPETRNASIGTKDLRSP